MLVRTLRKWGLSIGTTVAILALVWAVGSVLAQEPAETLPQEPDGGEVAAPTGGSGAYGFTYQGRLQDGGVPADGNYDFEWTIWVDQTKSNPVSWSSPGAYHNIGVTDGLFSLYLFPTGATMNETFNGEARWITVYVRPSGTTTWTELPVQPISPTPYAWSLYPGAIISGTATGYGLGGAVFNVSNDATWYPAILAQSSTASAVRGESPGGIGVNGYTDDGYAVFAWDYGTAEARGYGGFFGSNNGVPLYGVSYAYPHYQNMYAPAIYARSYYGTGVYGVSECDGWPCYGGYFESDIGVYGRSASTSTLDAGVYGYNSADGGNAIHGYRYSGPGVGVRGTNDGTGSGVAGRGNSYVGVFGWSTSDRGVEGMTNSTDHNYGLYSTDNLYAREYHLRGAIMQVVQNGGSASLAPGDVVVFSGMTASLEEEGLPVIQVAHAAEANDTAVAGVVYRRFNIDAVSQERTPEGADGETGLPIELDGPVAPGDYLLLVVHGPAEVRTSALSGDIQTGDLLSTGDQAGYAAAASQVTVDGVAFTPPGIVFGKALEPLGHGRDGTIYVFVTLQ